MKKNFFSLVEVLIALAIVFAVAVAALSFVAGDTVNATLEKDANLHRHLLTNIVEYHLAAGIKAQIPDELLPEDYSFELERRALEAEEVSVPSMASSLNGLQLLRLEWKLLKNGEEVDMISMDRILSESALEEEEEE